MARTKIEAPMMPLEPLSAPPPMPIRRPRRAKGGPAVQVYNAQGSEAVKSAKDETEGFTHGGAAKRKHGGMAEGHEAPMRGDRASRGRHAAGGRAGGSPLSSGHALKPPKNDEAGRGHEGVAAPPEPF